MDATLHIHDNFISLTLPVALDVPALEIESLKNTVLTFNYRWKLSIEVRDGVTRISTVHGSGRGQANRFDELAGSEIAALRLALTRQLRRISAPETHIGGEQTVSVFVSDDDVDRMQKTISDFEATPDGETFWMNGMGPYSKEALLEMGEAQAERDRVMSLTPEERLLEAIFGKDHKKPTD